MARARWFARLHRSARIPAISPPAKEAIWRYPVEDSPAAPRLIEKFDFRNAGIQPYTDQLTTPTSTLIARRTRNPRLESSRDSTERNSRRGSVIRCEG